MIFNSHIPAVKREEVLAAVDDDLVAMYVEETNGLSERVVRMFLAQDAEPPQRATVDRVGFNAFENRVLAPFLSTAEDQATDDRAPVSIRDGGAGVAA